MTRDEILLAHPLTVFLMTRGVAAAVTVTNVCPVTKHAQGHRCVSIDVGRQLWHCNDCGVGGSIIDWLMKESDKSAKQVIDELGGVQESSQPAGRVKVAEATINAIYDYPDASGSIVFQVVRYEPKAFRQRRPDGHGGWTWDLNGITRVLYNMPKISIAQEIVVTEGEKDCKTLEGLGFTATCNAGGASSWLAAYGDYLKGKDVVIIPDNDPAGKKWVEAVTGSLVDKANSVKVVYVPAPHKDVSDWVGACEVAPELAKLISLTSHTVAPLPLFTILEMETRYRDFIRHLPERSFDLAKFLPGLGVRQLVPGELVLIMADTGVGKSMLCQGLAKAANPLPTLFFELELPLELMYERFIQMETGCHGHEVAGDYRDNDDSYARGFTGLHHIIVCPESGLTTTQIENYILRSELKFGRPPVLVCVDYIGLVRSIAGRGRYESVSESAEALKVIAKKTGTIVIMASQIARPDQKKQSVEIRLHDGKDSGSLENSAGLILGCWRPEPYKMVIRVLKNTKGCAGHTVECDFDGSRMSITECKKKC